MHVRLALPMLQKLLEQQQLFKLGLHVCILLRRRPRKWLAAIPTITQIRVETALRGHDATLDRDPVAARDYRLQLLGHLRPAACSVDVEQLYACPGGNVCQTADHTLPTYHQRLQREVRA